MKSQEKLTKRQLQVLPFLLAYPTYEEAARQAHVSVKQIYCWLKTSTFKAELDRRRNEIIEEAVNKLKYHTTKAADTLVSLLSHSNPTIQRGVANDLLNHVTKFIELHEIEERIQLLEAKVKSLCLNGMMRMNKKCQAFMKRLFQASFLTKFKSFQQEFLKRMRLVPKRLTIEMNFL